MKIGRKFWVSRGQLYDVIMITIIFPAAVQNERDRIIRRPSEDTNDGNGITANMLLQAEVLSRPAQPNTGW